MRVTWLALEWPRHGVHSGGVGRYVLRMAQEVAKLVDLTVVTFEGAVEQPGIRFVTIPAPHRRIDRYYCSAWRARAAVASTRPDLIHAHGDDFLLGDNAPIVRTFYGLSLSEARSSKGLRRANHFVLAGLEQWSARRAVMRLGIAVEAVDHFKCESLFPPFFGSSPVAARRPSPAPTVVFIGSFHGRKQGWLAQRAVAQLHAAENFRNARLIVVGPAEDALHWEPWVDHRSGISDHDVSELLSRAWLLVSPSAYEGFGIPIVEALAHDVPVVAIQNPGSSYIHDQSELKGALILTSEDNFVVDVAKRIASGPKLSSSESRSAKQIISQLTYAGSPDRLVSLYAEACSKRRDD